MLNSNHIVMIAIGNTTGDNQPVGIVLGRRGDGEEEKEKGPPPTPPARGKDPPPTPPVKGGEQYAKEFVVFLHFISILLPSLREGLGVGLSLHRRGWGRVSTGGVRGWIILRFV